MAKSTLLSVHQLILWKRLVMGLSMTWDHYLTLLPYNLLIMFLETKKLSQFLKTFDFHLGKYSQVSKWCVKAKLDSIMKQALINKNAGRAHLKMSYLLVEMLIRFILHLHKTITLFWPLKLHLKPKIKWAESTISVLKI